MHESYEGLQSINIALCVLVNVDLISFPRGVFCFGAALQYLDGFSVRHICSLIYRTLHRGGFAYSSTYTNLVGVATINFAIKWRRHVKSAFSPAVELVMPHCDLVTNPGAHIYMLKHNSRNTKGHGNTVRF